MEDLKLFDVPIYEIQVLGKTQTAFRITKGSSVRLYKTEMIITKIERDLNWMLINGESRFLIFAKKKGGKYDFLWKEFINYSVEVTYEMPSNLE